MMNIVVAIDRVGGTTRRIVDTCRRYRVEQLVLDRFLSGTQNGEGRMEFQAPQAFARPELQIEKVDEAFELGEETLFVAGREHDGLGDARAELHEDEFGP